MILNSDCIRAVLLAVERAPFNAALDLDDLVQQLPAFTKDELWYTCLKLDEGGFLTLITATIPRSLRPGILNIVDLTYQGHEFLSRIRDEKRWSATKKVLSAVGDYSLAAVSAVAEGVTSAAISAHFQQTGL